MAGVCGPPRPRYSSNVRVLRPFLCPAPVLRARERRAVDWFGPRSLPAMSRGAHFSRLGVGKGNVAVVVRDADRRWKAVTLVLRRNDAGAWQLIPAEARADATERPAVRAAAGGALVASRTATCASVGGDAKNRMLADALSRAFDSEARWRAGSSARSDPSPRRLARPGRGAWRPPAPRTGSRTAARLRGPTRRPGAAPTAWLQHRARRSPARARSLWPGGAETTAELNLRTLARLSGVSAAQASRVLERAHRAGSGHTRTTRSSALRSTLA
jgi:hypothetical protein